MALEGGALAGAWIGGLLAGVLVLALLLYLFRMFMQVLFSCTSHLLYQRKKRNASFDPGCPV